MVGVIGPYGAVLRTYLQRPLFRVLALACLAWPVFDLMYRWETRRGFANIPTAGMILRDLTEQAWHLALPILFGVGWAAHLREQLARPRSLLVPRHVRPHLRVAAAVLIASVFVIPAAAAMTDLGWRTVERLMYGWNRVHFGGPWWEQGGAYIGGLLIGSMLTLLAAWLATFGSPWKSALLAPVVLAAVVVAHFNPWWLYSDLYFDVLAYFYKPDGLDYGRYAVRQTVFVATFLPLLADALLLAGLRARLRGARGVAGAERHGRPSARVESRGQAGIARTTWAIVRHRRASMLSRWAPAVTGVLLAGVVLAIQPLLHDPRNPEAQMQVSMLLATILPAVAVGCLWAERWPRLAAESLLPATRRQFVAETALAVGVDLASFWVAIAIGVTVPLVLFPAEPTDWRALAARLGASAAVQAVALGAVLWGLVLRSWPALATLLGIALMAMAGPLLVASKREPMVPIATLVPGSLVMAGIGYACVALAWRRLLRGNLA